MSTPTPTPIDHLNELCCEAAMELLDLELPEHETYLYPDELPDGEEPTGQVLRVRIERVDASELND